MLIRRTEINQQHDLFFGEPHQLVPAGCSRSSKLMNKKKPLEDADESEYIQTVT